MKTLGILLLIMSPIAFAKPDHILTCSLKDNKHSKNVEMNFILHLKDGVFQYNYSNEEGGSLVTTDTFYELRLSSVKKQSTTIPFTAKINRITGEIKLEKQTKFKSSIKSKNLQFGTCEKKEFIQKL